MGLDRYPELHGELYFRNYSACSIWPSAMTPPCWRKARQAADYLGLPLEVRPAGYGALESRLLALLEKR